MRFGQHLECVMGSCIPAIIPTGPEVEMDLKPEAVVFDNLRPESFMQLECVHVSVLQLDL